MRHKVDRVNAFIFDWDQRTLTGWSHSIKEGDEIEVPMQSGKMALLRVTKVNRMSDPKNQYFADLEDIGYVDNPKLRSG